MEIKLNRPDSEEILKFGSTAELLNLEQIKFFKTYPDFYQFSIGGDLLMVEFGDGSSWWALGTITGTVDLPKWVPKDSSLMDTKRITRDLQGNLTMEKAT
jgi:hypothetical protein